MGDADVDGGGGKRVRKEGKKIDTTRRGKMGGFDLADAAATLNEGAKMKLDAVVADTAEVFEERTRKEVGRISRKGGVGRAGTSTW